MKILQIETQNKKRTPNKSSKIRKKHSKQNPLHRIQVRDGMTVRTKDNFLEGGYIKPGYENAQAYYRKCVVLQHNQNDELMLVALINPDDKHKGKIVEDNKNRKSKYKPFVETKNHLNQPIIFGKFFIPNIKSDFDIKKTDFDNMLKKCKYNELNKRKFDEFYKRNKKL